MRIPFPERITPWHAVCFAALLAIGEIFEGTPPLFAACVFAYIVMAAAAFNAVGGLYRASGAYIFANAILSLILSQCAKVILGEPADSNLRDPMTTIMVYASGMAAILIAAVISRRFLPRVPLLERDDTPENNRQIAVGCLSIGILLPFIAGYMGGGEGSVASALGQFNQFAPLGMVLAIYDEIQTSRGRSSVNIVVIVGTVYAIGVGGILGTSKQGLFIPVAIYAAVCGALRYRFRMVSVVAMAVGLFFMVYYLVPYSQVVRNYTRDLPTFGERIDGAIYWLGRLDEVRAQYSKSDADVALQAGPHYYSGDEGFLERLSMIGIDDAMINVADNGPKFGYSPMVFAIGNTIPHFLWRDKPFINYNNIYGHEVGVIADSDDVTSVSFGPSADAFNMGGWIGVWVLMPISLILMFTVVDSVTGSIKKTPWALGYTVFFLHAAAESGLEGCIGVAVQVTIVLVVSIYVARYAMPILGSLVLPEKRKSVIMRRVREFPKTAPPTPPTEIASKPI